MVVNSPRLDVDSGKARLLAERTAKSMNELVGLLAFAMVALAVCCGAGWVVAAALWWRS
jgi:hypothetical protein